MTPPREEAALMLLAEYLHERREVIQRHREAVARYNSTPAKLSRAAGSVFRQIVSGGWDD